VEETLKALREEGHIGVVLQPIGFLCDHVEILYDIDVAFKEIAAELGMKLWRAESLNDSPVLTQTLIGVVRSMGTSTMSETVAAEAH
jgi:ferrochelatase